MASGLQGILPNKCFQDFVSEVIKMRGSWVFGEIAAGESDEQGFNIPSDIETPYELVVCVSPILAAGDTYNPDLHYYGYVNESTGKVVIGVKNNGSTAEIPPDVYYIVF